MLFNGCWRTFLLPWPWPIPCCPSSLVSKNPLLPGAESVPPRQGHPNSRASRYVAPADRAKQKSGLTIQDKHNCILAKQIIKCVRIHTYIVYIYILCIYYVYICIYILCIYYVYICIMYIFIMYILWIYIYIMYVYIYYVCIYIYIYYVYIYIMYI